MEPINTSVLDNGIRVVENAQRLVALRNIKETFTVSNLEELHANSERIGDTEVVDHLKRSFVALGASSFTFMEFNKALSLYKYANKSIHLIWFVKKEDEHHFPIEPRDMLVILSGGNCE